MYALPYTPFPEASRMLSQLRHACSRKEKFVKKTGVRNWSLLGNPFITHAHRVPIAEYNEPGLE